jgi:hypothetical protein
MRQMAGIARLSKENIDELIGSDSFCYVDILAFPEGGLSSGVMYTTLTTFGIHPLSNVEVRFYDDDARDRIHKSQGYTLYNLLAGSERFSYSYLTAGTSLSPLSSEVWTNTETFKNYSVEVSAKNGSFFELLQIRRDGSRLEEGHYGVGPLFRRSEGTGLWIHTARLRSGFTERRPVELDG